jgi:plasmid replication initiation protein
MMSAPERELALKRMEEAIRRFYSAAVQIGNHPFVEFAGVMTAYAKSCRRAHDAGVDFTECNRHAGSELPMESVELDYLVEKLDCIFGGRITAGA